MGRECEVIEQYVHSTMTMEKAAVNIIDKMAKLLAFQCKENCDGFVGANSYHLLKAANDFQKYTNQRLLLLRQFVEEEYYESIVVAYIGAENQFIEAAKGLKELYCGLTARDTMRYLIEEEYEVAESLVKKRYELLMKRKSENNRKAVWENGKVDKVYWCN